MLTKAEIRRQKQTARRRTLFKKEMKAHIRELPARFRVGRYLAAGVVFILSEPYVGWLLAALFAAGLLCALFIRLTDDAPTVIDLD